MMVTGLDAILELQIKIARLGEIDQLDWWRVDATDPNGGGHFFKRLVGQLSGLSAVEAALMGARTHEKKLLDAVGTLNAGVTLFNPELALKRKLDERWQHFKANPSDIPATIQALVNPEWTCTPEEFSEYLKALPKPSFERTRFGRKVKGQIPEDPLSQMLALASLLVPLEKKTYPLPYIPLS